MIGGSWNCKNYEKTEEVEKTENTKGTENIEKNTNLRLILPEDRVRFTCFDAIIIKIEGSQLCINKSKNMFLNHQLSLFFHH